MNSHYYVQAEFGGACDLVLYGHTENIWLAKQFYSSLTKNRMFLDSYDTEEEAIRNVVFDEFKGSLTDFCEYVKNTYRLTITGEDIIDVFETGIPLNTNQLLPTASVVSTLGIVLGGSFTSYAERFLLPMDIKRVRESMGWLTFFLGYTRDTFLSSDKVNTIILFLKKIQDHPIYADGSKSPFLLDEVFTDDSNFDVIRYGIVKGWYHAI